MFSPELAVGKEPVACPSVLWTNMESNKVMCPTFSVMLVRTIKALCEINIRFDHKLEISGSLHVRSDGDKVMTCLIDEESIKGAQDLSILDAVRFTMPYAAAALAPMAAIPGGFSQQSAQLTEALMSPMGQTLQQATLPTTTIANIDKDSNKHAASNGAPVATATREQPHVVNIVPTEQQSAMHAEMSNLAVVNDKTHEFNQMPESEAAMLAQRRLSGDVPRSDVTTPSTSLKPSGPAHRPPAKARPSHSSLPHDVDLQNMAPSTTQPPAPAHTNTAQQNHVKLPNIQTFAGMLPRLPQVKTETKDAASPLPRTTETPSFPSPPQQQNVAGSPMSAGYMDPLVGVKVEVQSQVDSEGNVIQKKKYQCMFCGIFLSTKCYLKNHINAMHTKARVYPCEVCEKYFYSAGALRIHKLRNHWQGSKKHKCDHCGETFLLPIELRKHLMKKHAEMEDFEAGMPPASVGNLPRSTTDPNTAPSSGSSSPRVYVDKAIYPASLAQSMQSMTEAGLMHGSPVFPMPHMVEGINKDLMDTDHVGLETDMRVTQGAPVFPSPIPQAIAHAGTTKSAITASVTDTSTE